MWRFFAYRVGIGQDVTRLFCSTRGSSRCFVAGKPFHCGRSSSHHREWCASDIWYSREDQEQSGAELGFANYPPCGSREEPVTAIPLRSNRRSLTPGPCTTVSMAQTVLSART